MTATTPPLRLTGAPPSAVPTGGLPSDGDWAFEPDETGIAQEDRVFVASPWKLVWWKFRKHRLAVVAALTVIALYFVAGFAEFLAPYDANAYSAALTYAPPTTPHVFDAEGNFHARPFVYGLSQTVEPTALRRVFTIDTSKRYEIGLFVQGSPYKLMGLIPWDRHLYGVSGDGVILLAGADRLGQDMVSRVIFGTRISMTISLISIFVSFVLGVILGGVSGYYGGTIDNAIQRLIEVLRSFPHIPLWIALSAAVPKNWSALKTYFAILIILSIVNWTGLARVVRGRFLAMREEDFVTAARLVGSSERRIIFRHMLPSFASHIIASISLAIPGSIIGETSLSFLGIGLRPPVVSWGVLLQQAQNIRSVSQAPWLLLPGLLVVVAVLAFNFLGDGLRDAADPYAR
ncbi:MAG TPA: ABC transporter permease [Chloroflexota bacterium]|nr:ABC transporter permease [Chloroflexota bacterium]